MELKIDKAGRIILPKRVRERLRLRPGSIFTVEEGPEGILLRPSRPSRPSLMEEDGLLVHMGQAPAHFDWDRVTDDEREERLHEVGGL